ncbi:MAG: hypothetical protein DHS20C16_08460 [Phycisphaerae bacterium]|nr:MAG: hypothetical protein DHS20C16_08460 [Phycisphaerae bacterium]
MSHSALVISWGLSVLLATIQQANGQCQLANPSFELADNGAPVFAAWNQIGNLAGTGSPIVHGSRSAAVTGPNTGDFDVSAFWQRLDTTSGESWEVAGRVLHSSLDPLNGNAKGVVQVEWRNGGGNVISVESHDVLMPADLTDTWKVFSFTTLPAPGGTVAAHLHLAFSQSPAQETGTVFYDLIEFDRVGPPSRYDQQWSDFTGGRVVSFAGYNWRVKGPGVHGPGPNLFGDGPSHVWVDANDKLHMTIKNVGGNWFSSEVTLEDHLSYGDYIFTSVGQLDLLPANVVLGLFLWQYPTCYDPANPWNLHNEIDVEISRWGIPADDVAQFVVQPFDAAGNISRFDINYAKGERISYALRWLPDRIEARAWRGGPSDESPSTLIASWINSGPHLPRPEQPRVHINLWQLNGPPSDGQNQEVELESFRFVPICVDLLAEERSKCFLACLDGPGANQPSTCGEYDFDNDGDIDLHDFANQINQLR